MRKPDPTEEALSQLRAMRESGEMGDLAPFLKSKSSAVVARAAEMSRNEVLVPALIEAFRRICPFAQKRDPGCRALTNIAEALLRLEAPSAEVYSLGICYHQWEATWGPAIDTAAGLRSACAMGLVAIGDPEALLACAELLNDEHPDARIGAARALGSSGRPDAELLLRFKARLGDEKFEVVGELFSALINLGPRERSIPYVAEFLRANADETAELAAVALGESRNQEAVQHLKNAFNAKLSRSRAGAILWGLALSRDEEALEFCFRELERGSGEALEALSLYQLNPIWRTRVRALLDAIQNTRLDAIWSIKWGG